jgi:hypothetical protein
VALAPAAALPHDATHLIRRLSHLSIPPTAGFLVISIMVTARVFRVRLTAACLKLNSGIIQQRVTCFLLTAKYSGR